MSGITVKTFFSEKKEELKLELLSGENGLSNKIAISDINRPGVTFAGYLEHFSNERVQIIGLGEYSYLKSLSEKKQTEVLEKIYAFRNIPCFILARGLKPLPVMLKMHKKYKIPLFSTPLKTSFLMAELIYYLEKKMAETTTVHGVLVSVYGLGVLIVGDAGIGKSECALELVKRNHMFVADDVVEISKHSGGNLIGKREKLIQHHMEIRGMGIIDVSKLFGIGFILDESKIELIIRLEEWKNNRNYERAGLEEHYTMILGVKVPEIVFPVRTGRNLAILVEIASLNQRLKKKGYYSAKELNKQLIKLMSK